MSRTVPESLMLCKPISNRDLNTNLATCNDPIVGKMLRLWAKSYSSHMMLERRKELTSRLNLVKI